MKFLLTAKVDHEVTGELGWQDSRVAYNSPYTPLVGGIGIAHDCLEHHQLSTVADEIQAHGAMYWGRYQGGWYCPLNGNNLTLVIFGYEWVNLYLAMMDYNLDVPSRTKSLDKDVEADLDTIIEEGRQTLFKEYGPDGDNLDYRDRANEIANKFRGWFRKGFRAAALKYNRLGWQPHDVAHLFNQLTSSLGKRKPQYEGEQLQIVINKDMHIRLTSPQEELY